ncbi:MAG TPA: isopentenyl transferase family protein, partial [Alphaproteobacteria bacterium]|nr:isopentenyl transferase family protein [Alphaproteobacteria bacterium]
MSGDGRESGIVLIAGPTASGKSALALDLAEVLGGTIINADSMQIYRELRILSARPGEDEEARVPHKLYGVLSAAQSCSAALWRDLALNAIADVRAEGRLPIIVGGTGLYFRALL